MKQRLATLVVWGIASGMALSNRTALANEAAQDGAAKPLSYALPALTTPDFCSLAQKFMAQTTLQSRNIIHTDYEAFVLSKPDVQPLTTQQYVQYAPDDAKLPMRISCKMKSGDHLNAVHGASSASAAPRLCREANQQIVLAVYASMTRSEFQRVKYNPDNIMLDGDDMRYIGSSWIEPFESHYIGADKRLHLLSKSLYAGWNDWRWKLMPERFRGTHYCHLVAPEFARALMLGETDAPPRATR
jgi:hypothetical protein